MKKSKFLVILSLLLALCAVVSQIAINADAAEAQTAVDISRSDGVWLWPLPNYEMSDWAGCNGNASCYFHPGNNHGGCAASSHATANGYGHSGFDAGASIGTPVYAMAAGTAYVRYQDARGYYVVVEHPAGKDGSGNSWSYYTYYQHLSEFAVADGTPVSAGTIIARTGNSGTSTGPHLHVGMVLGKSGCYDSIYALENKGWVKTPGFQEGRILNNPALNSPAGQPEFIYGDNVRLHAGSVMYTRNVSEVSIGETKKSYETMAEGTYAIKCPAAGLYVTVQDNLDVVGQNILATTTRTGFEIKKSSTTEGYAVRALCSANRMMNVYTEHVTSGNTVCLWDDTGHASQRWYFEKVSGGYVIRSVQTPSCVLTVEGDNDIGVATYSGIPGQIWTLEPYCTSHKYSSATCTEPKTCTNCGATSGKALGHSYSNACDTTCNRSGCKTTRKITHSYTAATCTKPKTCKVCGVTSGKALGHNYAAATCTKAKTCKACGVTSGKAKGHTYSKGKCTACNYKPTGAKITTQPKNVVVKNGKTAKVTVKASGDGLKYTWYYAKKGSSKYTKASATSSSYSVKMSSSANGRKVYCVVTDKYGNSVKSDVVTLYKGTPAKITTQPKTTTVANSKTGKLTIKASGSSLKYQWYVKYKGTSSFTKVGSSSKTYSFKMADKLNGAQVYCVVKDKYGTTVKSSVVTIKMAPKVKITTQPKNVAVAKGKTAKVTVKASGEGLKYTWYYAKKGSSSFKKLSAKSATYSVKMSSTYDGRKVYCVVTDKYGQTVKTSTVTLSMVKAAKISTQPKSVSAFAGKAMKVTVKATGDGLKYTWYYAKKGASGYTKASATGSAFEVKASSTWNGCKVYCVVKDKYGNSVKSSVVTLTVKNAVKITQQPSSFIYAATGSTVKATVKATGDGLKYTWYYANRWADKWTKSSVTSATYSVKMSSSVHYRTVYCVVKDKYGNSVKSDVVIFFNSVHLDKVEGSWVSTYETFSDGARRVNFDGEAKIDIDGSAYVSVSNCILYTGIEFVKKSANKYCYQMMEGPEYLQYNSPPYSDGLVDVIYDPAADTLELQFDYGHTVFFERAD